MQSGRRQRRKSQRRKMWTWKAFYKKLLREFPDVMMSRDIGIHLLSIRDWSAVRKPDAGSVEQLLQWKRPLNNRACKWYIFVFISVFYISILFVTYLVAVSQLVGQTITVIFNCFTRFALINWGLGLGECLHDFSMFIEKWLKNTNCSLKMCIDW